MCACVAACGNVYRHLALLFISYDFFMSSFLPSSRYLFQQYSVVYSWTRFAKIFNRNDGLHGGCIERLERKIFAFVIIFCGPVSWRLSESVLLALSAFQRYSKYKYWNSQWEWKIIKFFLFTSMAMKILASNMILF